MISFWSVTNQIAKKGGGTHWARKHPQICQLFGRIETLKILSKLYTYVCVYVKNNGKSLKG